MGPQILLDKSTLESLHQTELDMLYRYYYVVVAPILVVEIQADLEKRFARGTPEERVAALSAKLQPMDSKVTEDYRPLCIGSLLGAHVPMEGRPIVSGGMPLQNSDGRWGVYLEEQPIRKILRGWQNGEFDSSDRKIAALHREMLGSVDFEVFRSALKGSSSTGRFKDYAAVARCTEALVCSTDMTCRQTLLKYCIERLAVPKEQSAAIWKRWLDGGLPSMSAFAPYACYWLRVNMLLILGVLHGFVGTKASNILDSVYLYYLPFCKVFSSNDKVHRAMTPLLLKEDQVFVEGRALKDDLARLADLWSSMSEESKGTLVGPPVREESLTYRLWRKCMAGWAPGS